MVSIIGSSSSGQTTNMYERERPGPVWLKYLISAFKINLQNATELQIKDYEELDLAIGKNLHILELFESIIHPNDRLLFSFNELERIGAATVKQICEKMSNPNRMERGYMNLVRADLNKLRDLGILTFLLLEFRPNKGILYIAPFASESQIIKAKGIAMLTVLVKEEKIAEKAEIEFESKKRAARGLEKEFAKTPAQLAAKHGRPVQQVQRYDCTVCKFSFHAVKMPDICSQCRNRGHGAFVLVPAD